MIKEELWKEILRELELTVSKANFATWFQNTFIADQDEGKIIIGTPSAFIKEWLEDKYQKHILKCLRARSPEVRSIEFKIATFGTVQEKKAEPKSTEEQMDFRDIYTDRETNLNPKYTLDNFIVGIFNELAHASALSVIKNPGVLYNPLFIYGGVGLGKTHLMQAIGNKMKADYPDKKVYYVSAERFANELVAAIRNNETVFFKDKYRSFDVLIIDDIQFIASRGAATQEEIFHTFNSMHQANKQIIFSSDRPPKLIPNIEDRLRSRFEGGTIADIVEPDYETRLAILQSKTAPNQEYQPSLEILEYIASAVQSNIREMEGSLNSVIVRSKMKKRPLDLSEVKEILTKNEKPRKVLSAQQIIRKIAQFYDIQEKFLFEKTRRKEVVKPRQVAMYLLREDFNGSFPYIGQKFGGRDHTTAIHAYTKITNEIKRDDRLKEEIKTIRAQLYEEEKQ
ncbi:MAG: chromosomal replication initiator protein DnaA [Candidatus Niyogibacteria bacterium]|nr:MAG: chromosomal replication initiator protein DnaA [Candidatus Niyogibacteria bacterium]